MPQSLAAAELKKGEVTTYEVEMYAGSKVVR